MSGRLPPRARRRVRPHLERLEDRALLAVAAPGDKLLLTTAFGEVKTIPLAPGSSIDRALLVYGSRVEVLTAELDQKLHVAAVPDDPKLNSLWGLFNRGQTGGVSDADIDATNAWDITTGSTRTVVAVIDTGIDYTHPDLYLNIWLNPGEVPRNLPLVDTDFDGRITFRDLNEPDNAEFVADKNNNGRIDGYDVLRDPRWADKKDTDRNGYVDDLVGWDFANNDNNPFDDHRHGTHVAGTIGGLGNNGVGVAGINWNVQLAALKFLDGGGSGDNSDAVRAIYYAANRGIKISNNSWGGGGYSSGMAKAIAHARSRGHLFVAAAGNEGSNNDVVPSYPCNYGYDNVVSVAATTNADRLAGFSNYGRNSVDIAAPGAGIWSTVPGGGYASLSGTSMASPHVAGVAALLWSRYPNLTYKQVVTRLLSGVNKKGNLTNVVRSGGRLNAMGSINYGAGDTSGPYVVGALPNSKSAVTRVRVTFNKAVKGSTFTPDDILDFTGPTGAVTVQSVTAVAGSGGKQWDITVPRQTTVGDYSVAFGPDVTDTRNRLMDQNRNGVGGEAEDFYSTTFTLIDNSKEYTYTSRTRVPITDFLTRSSMITVPTSLSVRDVNVQVTIQHPRVGQLRLWLVGPDGTQVDLVTQRGGVGQNFTGTTFDDEAAEGIADGAAPFSGSYIPEVGLEAFDGLTTKGTWRLYVRDEGTGFIGRLESWSLVVRAGS